MKKLLLLMIFPFILNSNVANADDANKDAKETIEEFISQEASLIKLPQVGKKKFYTYCSSVQVTLIVGYETGKCVSMGIDSKGNIDYIPMELKSWKVSWGAGVGLIEKNLHRIKGVSSLTEISGFYLIASSGAGFIGTVRENWFTLKLSLKDLIGNTPEMDGDAPLLNVGLDIISLGIMQYKQPSGAKVQKAKI